MTGDWVFLLMIKLEPAKPAVNPSKIAQDTLDTSVCVCLF